MSDIEDHLDASPGFFIDQYKVVRKLGTGTFGRVFLCLKQQAHSGPGGAVAHKKNKNQNKFAQKGPNGPKGPKGPKGPNGRNGHSYDDDRARRDEEALAEAEATLNSPFVAVKVIRPVPKYIREAQDEVAIMRLLECPFTTKCIEARAWRDRYIVVTPAYGPNLY